MDHPLPGRSEAQEKVMRKKHALRLTEEERRILDATIDKLEGSSR